MHLVCCRFIGAFCGMVYIFTLPALVHMRTQKERLKLTKLSIVFHSTLVVLGVGIFVGQLLTIWSSSCFFSQLSINEIWRQPFLMLPIFTGVSQQLLIMIRWFVVIYLWCRERIFYVNLFSSSPVKLPKSSFLLWNFDFSTIKLCFGLITSCIPNIL